MEADKTPPDNSNEGGKTERGKEPRRGTFTRRLGAFTFIAALVDLASSSASGYQPPCTSGWPDAACGVNSASDEGCELGQERDDNCVPGAGDLDGACSAGQSPQSNGIVDQDGSCGQTIAGELDPDESCGAVISPGVLDDDEACGLSLSPPGREQDDCCIATGPNKSSDNNCGDQMSAYPQTGTITDPDNACSADEGDNSCGAASPDQNCTALASDATCGIGLTPDEKCSATDNDNNCGMHQDGDESCGSGLIVPVAQQSDENCSKLDRDENCKAAATNLDKDESCNRGLVVPEIDESCGKFIPGDPFGQADESCRPLPFFGDENCGAATAAGTFDPDNTLSL